MPQRTCNPHPHGPVVWRKERPVVVVMGNGRSVLDATLGPAIDACDVTVRCNDAVITGYEKHVGTRTDILFFCDALPDEQHAAEMVESEADVELVMYLVHREISSVDPRLRSRCEYVLYPVARAFAARHQLRKRPTTGMMAIWYCRERFPEADICLHGFDYVAGTADDQITHYWHQKTAKQLHTVHGIRREARLLRKWIQAGTVNLLREYLQERGYDANVTGQCH